MIWKALIAYSAHDGRVHIQCAARAPETLFQQCRDALRGVLGDDEAAFALIKHAIDGVERLGEIELRINGVEFNLFAH